jgi:hypothetical protein
MREIEIEEMPQGCVLSCNWKVIVVSSFEDADAIIESLQRMKFIQQQKGKMFHFHNFLYLREEYRLCKNPAFEQRIIIRQCVHCPKIDELADDCFRPTQRALDGAKAPRKSKLSARSPRK